MVATPTCVVWCMLASMLCPCESFRKGATVMKGDAELDVAGVVESQGNESSGCTAESKDPFSTGTYVECCGGLTKELGRWSGSERHHYRCSACTPEDQDPYSKDGYVACCAGLQKELGRWSSGSRKFYLCHRSSSPPPTPQLDATGPLIKFMSYNMFGYNAFNLNKWRGENIIKKIKAFEPAVFGAQEVEQGQGVPGGHEYVKGKLEMGGKYTYAGGNIFYLANVVEKKNEGGVWVDKQNGRRMDWAKFDVIQTGQEFLFFNTHWHNKGDDNYWFGNAKVCAKEIQQVRERFGSPALPTVLVGDFNVKAGQGRGSKAILYITGQTVDGQKSPVPLTDAIPDAPMRWGNVIDYILSSQGEWSVVSSKVDMDGFGGRNSGWASDHGALEATMQFLQ